MSAPRSGLAAVEQAFRSLPERYLGAPEGFDATYVIRVGDIGQLWEVRATEHAARVRRGGTRRRPDVTIDTDSETWLSIHHGTKSSVEAFSRRALVLRGDIDLAVGFEGLFRRVDGRAPSLRIRDVQTESGARISTLTMGAGPDVLLIHGLGGTKTSLFETAAALARNHRVHAIDLPGFGSSSKPLGGGYSAAWFAEHVASLLDALGVRRTHIVGNSLGGRIALELALDRPERVDALGLICPAVAFVRRELHPLVRLARPEIALVPHQVRRARVGDVFTSLFADPDLIHPAISDLMVDEFQRIYSSPGARLAFLAAARNIYLDRPFGERGFYARLRDLQAPSLFIWGSHDWLIPAAFKRHVASALPGAEQVVIQNCGHVPQIERPVETHALLRSFFAQASATRGRLASRAA